MSLSLCRSLGLNGFTPDCPTRVLITIMILASEHHTVTSKVSLPVYKVLQNIWGYHRSGDASFKLWPMWGGLHMIGFGPCKTQLKYPTTHNSFLILCPRYMYTSSDIITPLCIIWPFRPFMIDCSPFSTVPRRLVSKEWSRKFLCQCHHTVVNKTAWTTFRNFYHDLYQ